MLLAENGNDTNVPAGLYTAWTRGGGGGGGGGSRTVPHPRAPWLHYHNGDGCWTFNPAKPETKSILCVQNITDLSRVAGRHLTRSKTTMSPPIYMSDWCKRSKFVITIIIGEMQTLYLSIWPQGNFPLH